MQVLEHSRRAGNVRRRHRCAAEEGPSTTIARAASRLTHARDRAEDIHTDRGHVRFDGQIDRRWALAAEASEDILVRSHELLERRERCPFVLTEHDSRQVIATTAVLGHGGRVTCDIVEHHNSYSSGRDRVAHFRAKRATAAIDDYNIPGSARIDAGAGGKLGVKEKSERACR